MSVTGGGPDSDPLTLLYASLHLLRRLDDLQNGGEDVSDRAHADRGGFGERLSPFASRVSDAVIGCVRTCRPDMGDARIWEGYERLDRADRARMALHVARAVQGFDPPLQGAARAIEALRVATEEALSDRHLTS